MDRRVPTFRSRQLRCRAARPGSLLGGIPVSRTLASRVPPMAAYPFLSDEWLTEVRWVVDAHRVQLPDAADVTMNIVVTDTPFDDDRRLHIAVQDGNANWSAGTVADADLTLTTDY